jgi:hypothetical protein
MTSALDGVNGQRHAPVELYPRERSPGTHWIGGWVGLRADVDTEARGKFFRFCRGSNLDRAVVLSVVRHYILTELPRLPLRSVGNKNVAYKFGVSIQWHASRTQISSKSVHLFSSWNMQTDGQNQHYICLFHAHGAKTRENGWFIFLILVHIHLECVFWRLAHVLFYIRCV